MVQLHLSIRVDSLVIYGLAREFLRQILGLEKVAAGLEELRLRLWCGAPRAGTISERRYREAGQILLVALFSGPQASCADPGP